MALLGSTLAEIAVHKAGIMKPQRPCFTVPQPADAAATNSMLVFERHAADASTSVAVCTPFDSYRWSSTAAAERLAEHVRLAGLHNKQNIALALQLARAWHIEERGDGKFELFFVFDWLISLSDRAILDAEGRVTSRVEQAILATRWPGRNQEIRRGHLTWRLDGAHTPMSIEVRRTRQPTFCPPSRF